MNKDETEILVYTVRPDGTPIWLTAEVAQSLGVKSGDRLTRDQYDGNEVQRLIEERLNREIKKKTRQSPAQ